MSSSVQLDQAAPKRTEPSYAAGLIGFLFFALAGAGILATVVVLPEMVALAAIEAERDALAHQVECERQLAAYNDRLIGAIDTDPILTTRMMMRRGNYKLPGAQEVDVPVGDDPGAAPLRILAEARQTPPPPQENAFLRAGRWIDDGPTKTSLTVLALGLIAIGVVLFAPLPRRHQQVSPNIKQSEAEA